MGTLAALRALGPPKLAVVGRSGFSDAEIDAAAEGRFRVYTSMVELEPPIDWLLDPAGNRSFRFQLHSLQFLGVLYRRYERLADRAALRKAVEIGLDWARQNPLGGDGLSELAWYDMGVGLRAPYLAYGLRAAAAEELMDEDEAGEMLDSLREHGEFLADDENYAFGHNHGLFQDEGLLVLCVKLDGVLPEVARWREVATRRARATIEATVSADDAVHLEHSPGYHFAMTDLINRLVERGRVQDPELVRLRQRMIETAGWLILPDGMLAQIGDTNHVRAPQWSLEAGERALGTVAFRHGGYAVARRRESALVMTAGYYSAAHKQADELSFVLYDRGRLVLGDAGIWSYDEDDPYRSYARSSWAHNALIVDGESFDWRGQEPYGSGILAAGEGEGWHGLLGRNPLLAPRGLTHNRLVLWRPGVGAIVLDRVESHTEHGYTRLFHLGPGMEVDRFAGTLLLEAPGFSGELRDWSEVLVDTEIVHGRGLPDPLGWTFPTDQEREPVWVVAMTARARSAVLVSVLSLDAATPLRVAGAGFSPADASVRLLHGDDARTVRVAIGERSLSIEEAAW